MKKKITIIDYDAGNIFNLLNTLKKFDCKIQVTNKSKEIIDSDKIIIPGVGAYSEGIKNLKKNKLIDSILSFFKKERPILGICLGMQYLMDYSEEFGKTYGMGIIQGNVKNFNTINSKIKVPHVGWNYLSFNNDQIFKNLKNLSTFYFCHSFFVNPKNKANLIAKTSYSSIKFCSVIKKGNLYGCQFHPERSGRDGEIFLNNFLSI